MGLFGNNNGEKIELAKEMAHNANDANKEIGDVLLEFEENNERFENVTDNVLDLSQKILGKLADSEMKELTELTETVCELHKEYMKSFRMIMDLSKSQNNRTEIAIEKYQRIAGN